MRQPKIGIWGSFKSGKTSYLAALYLEMNDPQSNWIMQPVDTDDQSSKDYIFSITRSLKNGAFPKYTEIGATYMFYIAHRYASYLYHPKGNFVQDRNKKYSLMMIDAGGALAQKDSPVAEKILTNYYDYLRSCDGILIVIDPEFESAESTMGTETIGEMIRALIERLNYDVDEDESAHSKPDRAISVCITKMDLDHLWVRRNDAVGFLEEIIGAESFDLLSSLTRPGRLSVFPTSVAGRYTTPQGLERPNIMMTTQGTKLLARRDREPYGLREPLLWLFAQFDDTTLTRLQKVGRRSSNDKRNR